MFETAVVRAHGADRRLSFMSLSLALHSAAVAAVIAAGVASTQFPGEAPRQMLPVVLAPDLTLPPPLGNAAPKSKPVVAPKAPIASVPRVTGHQLPVASASATGNAGPETVHSDSSGTNPGVPWGTEGGVDVGSQPPVAPDAAGPLLVRGAVKAPVVIRRVDPLYPRIAIQAHVSGSVVLQCVIDKTGHIRDVRVVSSSFAAFEQPAIDAVQQWLFSPGTLNGERVDTIFELTVRFVVR